MRLGAAGGAGGGDIGGEIPVLPSVPGTMRLFLASMACGSREQWRGCREAKATGLPCATVPRIKNKSPRGAVSPGALEYLSSA